MSTSAPGAAMAEAKSALLWWIESGVDVAIQDEPRNWLRAAPPSADAAPGAEPPAPSTLAEFRSWLAESPSVPLAGTTARRVLPTGPELAPVMLIVDAPTSEAAANGEPLAGESKTLAERMLAAIGIAAKDAYVAPLCSFPLTGARLNGGDLQACADLARRHVALARPERLLLLGDGPARALLGKGVVEARGHLHRVEGVRTVATFGPRHLLQRPLDKALAWKDLLLLMEDDG